MKSDQAEKIYNFVRHSVMAVSNIFLYSINHPQVGNLCEKGITALKEAIANNPDLSLMVIDGELIHDGTMLKKSMYFARFAQLLANRGIGSVRFTREIDTSELKNFIGNLAKKGGKEEPICSSPNILLGKVEVCHTLPGEEGSVAGPEPEGPGGSKISEGEIAKLMEIYDEVQKHKKLRVVGIQEIVNGIVDILKQGSTPFLGLAPLRSADEYTFTHSLDVCSLNIAQAMGLGIEGQLLYDIGISAMLHDIGKLFVPVEIINKPGSLDKKEWLLMKQHTIRGAEYLLGLPGIPKLAVITAFEHHMKFNYAGYPEAPKGWKQNLCSQITTISDHFDAMRTRRSYRNALETEQVISFMNEKLGSELHPGLTKNFFKILRRYNLEQKQEGGKKEVVILSPFEIGP